MNPINEGLQIRWWNARDRVFGYMLKQDVVAGLDQARVCAQEGHEEARWLVAFFPPNATPPIDAEAVLGVMERSGHDQNDVCFLCYVGVLAWRREWILRAALAGHSFAQVWLMTFTHEGDSDRWLELAYNQGERTAIAVKSMTFARTGQDRQAHELAERAARLECSIGTWNYGCTLDDRLERYRYYCRSASVTSVKEWAVYSKMRKALRNKDWPIVWIIGTCFRPHQSRQSKSWDRIVHLCAEWTVGAKRGALTWLLCARSLGLYKDMAQLVAREVYRARERGWFVEREQEGVPTDQQERPLKRAK